MRSIGGAIRGGRVAALSVVFFLLGAGSLCVAAAEPASEKPAGKEVAKSEQTLEASAVNLLVNGDFEIPPLPGATSVDFDFWGARPGYPVWPAIVKSPSAHSGRQVLKLSATPAGAPYVAGQFVTLIEGAEKYLFECYARGPRARLGLVIYSWGGEEIRGFPQRVVETQESEIFSLGPEWKLCRMEYKPAKEKMYKCVTVSFHAVAGEAEVDDARLLAVGGKAPTNGKFEQCPWRGNRLGLSHNVPPPFVAVKVSPAGAEAQALTAAGPLAGPFVLSCWGRAYRFAEGPLPSEIDSTGASLLARPVTFRVSADGEASAAMEWRGREMKDCRPDVVKLASDGVVNLGGEKKLNLAVETSFEFDGMLRYDVTLQPKEAVTLKEFSLEIPLRPEAAKLWLWRAADPKNWRGQWGSAPRQPWHSAFSPTIWLGDQNRGLCWFAEAPRGWGNKGAEDRQVEMAPSKDSLLLRINFINVPTRVDAQRTWSFALLATPAKPVPAFPANQNVMESSNAKPEVAIEYISGGMPGRNINIADLLGGDPLEYYVQPKEKEVLREVVRQAHAHKHLIIPWQQGTLVEMLPGYTERLPEWMKRPAIGLGQYSGVQWINYCQQSEWRDLLLYSVVELVKEYGFDGVYFDTGITVGCENPAHGCGYLDGEGRWRPGCPMFAEREFKKRLYRALYEAMGRQPYICTLMNGIQDFAAATFDTAILSGEEWNDKVSEDYRAVASLPQWEAQYNPTQWGVWGLFLPSGAARQTPAATNSFLAFALLEHTPLWVAHGDEKVMLAALGAIDKLGPDMRFVPRWEADKYIQPSSSQCPASLYVAKEEAVIVLSNFGNAAVETSVLCDAQALGWKTPAGRAVDALTGAALNVSGNRIAVTVPANGFVMVRVSPGA